MERIVRRDDPPFMLITIDTEGDDLWSRPREITTRNARFLPRFQELCESNGLKPTYLTNFEMVNDPFFVEFGRDLLTRGRAEIGMHLHAWNSPPLVPLTPDDFHHQPYLAEYPEPVLREKVAVITELLEETFGLKMLSHRAGRWRMSPEYARALVDLGYRVDCSVTPHISWKRKPGDPLGDGGADYSFFPERAYFLDLDDLSSPGESTLLEVPMTILSRRRPLLRLIPSALRSNPLAERVINKVLPTDWLMPTRWNRNRFESVLSRALLAKREYVELAIHSSELMPGGSPNFQNEDEIEDLYERLNVVFELARESCRGATLSEYRARFDDPQPPGTGPRSVTSDGEAPVTAA